MTDLEKFRDFLFNEYNIINPLLTFDGDYILDVDLPFLSVTIHLTQY
ncbi:MAG: hypothetical protein K6C11_02255 [Bacilli bacterium]|nr:hypothetical protein [Bacilli bacterium]